MGPVVPATLVASDSDWSAYDAAEREDGALERKDDREEGLAAMREEGAKKNSDGDE